MHLSYPISKDGFTDSVSFLMKYPTVNPEWLRSGDRYFK